MNQYEKDYQQGYDKANEEWQDRINRIKTDIKCEAEMYKLIDRQMANVFNEVLKIIDKHLNAGNL